MSNPIAHPERQQLIDALQDLIRSMNALAESEDCPTSAETNQASEVHHPLRDFHRICDPGIIGETFSLVDPR